VHVCLESTGRYGEGIAEFLFEQGHKVSVVNPARIKHYGESKLHRNKADKADARLISEFCEKEQPNLWTPPPEHMKRLRSLVRYQDDLAKMAQQERNRLSSGPQVDLVATELKAHIKYIEQRMASIHRAIDELIKATPELKLQSDLLISIPGIGKWTAARLLAEIGDISCFDDAPQLAAFAGLNPKGFRSGTSVHKKTRISKEGRPFLRYILYMPSLVAWKRNPIIHTFCSRLEVNGLPKMAIVAAAMRKLLHIVFGVLKHQKPFDPNFLANQPIPA
jgi:transposase